MNDIDVKIQKTSILVNKLLAKEEQYNQKKLKTEKIISRQKAKLTRIIKKEKEKFQKMKTRLENELTVISDQIQEMKLEFNENISPVRGIEKKENYHA